MKRMILNFGAYLLTVALLLVVFGWMMKPGEFDVLFRLTPGEIAVTALIGLKNQTGRKNGKGSDADDPAGTAEGPGADPVL